MDKTTNRPMCVSCKYHARNESVTNKDRCRHPDVNVDYVPFHIANNQYIACVDARHKGGNIPCGITGKLWADT